VSDPLIAVAIGLVGSLLAGPAVAYGLDRIPRPWQRTATWVLIIGGASVAILADLLYEGPVGGLVIYVLAVLPGTIAFLAFRTVAASALVSLLPMYFVITSLTRGWPAHRPELPLDRAITLAPSWMLVYGSLYVFIGVLPVLVVRQRDLFRRAMQSYLTVMLVAYAGFLLYPTAAPRPAQVAGDGFGAWSLRLAYSLDPPYGCFPSLHVAYAFVSALTCYRVHSGVGWVAAVWAALIGVSTVYTKQHFVVDVIAGAAIAFVAYAVFLRPYPQDASSDDDRRRAPVRALSVVGIFGAVVVAFWIAYLSGWEPEV
jgi:membrane-associated phospholipid phosphatase